MVCIMNSVVSDPSAWSTLLTWKLAGSHEG